MSFSVELHPKAVKFLRKLPADVSERIVLKVKELSKNPYHYLEHLRLIIHIISI